MAPSRSIARKLRTALTLGPRRQLLVLEASASLFAARMALAVFPFRVVSKRFGVFVSPTDPRAQAGIRRQGEDRARAAKTVAWAVQATAPWMPFRSVCLQQAMAAQMMLRRRGIDSVMHFGAGKGDEKPIDAHAWLDAAGVKVTGYPVSPHMAEIGCFV